MNSDPSNQWDCRCKRRRPPTIRKCGPSQRIFLPGCWMTRDAENEIVVLEPESENCPANLPTNSKAIW